MPRCPGPGCTATIEGFCRVCILVPQAIHEEWACARSGVVAGVPSDEAWARYLAARGAFERARVEASDRAERGASMRIDRREGP